VSVAPAAHLVLVQHPAGRGVRDEVDHRAGSQGGDQPVSDRCPGLGPRHTEHSRRRREAFRPGTLRPCSRVQPVMSPHWLAVGGAGNVLGTSSRTRSPTPGDGRT
jgi:hypothetical protein